MTLYDEATATTKKSVISVTEPIVTGKEITLAGHNGTPLNPTMGQLADYKFNSLYPSLLKHSMYITSVKLPGSIITLLTSYALDTKG